METHKNNKRFFIGSMIKENENFEINNGNLKDITIYHYIKEFFENTIRDIKENIFLLLSFFVILLFVVIIIVCII